MTTEPYNLSNQSATPQTANSATPAPVIAPVIAPAPASTATTSATVAPALPSHLMSTTNMLQNTPLNLNPADTMANATNETITTPTATATPAASATPAGNADNAHNANNTATPPKSPKKTTGSQAQSSKNVVIIPLNKKDPSKDALKLAETTTSLFLAPLNTLLDEAIKLKAFTPAELKITQALLSHSGQEKLRVNDLCNETDLSLESISTMLHTLKIFEIVTARQSIVRFVKQADPQQSLSDPLDAFGSHRSMRLGCAEQCIAGEAISLMESQMFYFLKQRKVVQPTDLIYFVKNPADRKALFRFLVWSRLFNKVVMDKDHLLHFVPKYKAPKAVPNPSHTSTPVASNPSSSSPSSSSSSNSTGNNATAQGIVTTSTATTTANITAARNSALAPSQQPHS